MLFPASMSTHWAITRVTKLLTVSFNDTQGLSCSPLNHWQWNHSDRCHYRKVHRLDILCSSCRTFCLPLPKRPIPTNPNHTLALPSNYKGLWGVLKHCKKTFSSSDERGYFSTLYWSSLFDATCAWFSGFAFFTPARHIFLNWRIFASYCSKNIPSRILHR